MSTIKFREGVTRSDLGAACTGPHAGSHRALHAIMTIPGIEKSGRLTGFSAWLHAHDGQDVTTTQVSGDGCWRPGPRTVKAGRTFAILGDSRRDYAGMKELASSETWLAAWDTAMSTYVIYEAVAQ